MHNKSEEKYNTNRLNVRSETLRHLGIIIGNPLYDIILRHIPHPSTLTTGIFKTIVTVVELLVKL